MLAPDIVLQLIERFERNFFTYRLQEYHETRLQRKTDALVSEPGFIGLWDGLGLALKRLGVQVIHKSDIS